MPPKIYLHNHTDFSDLIRIVFGKQDKFVGNEI